MMIIGPSKGSVMRGGAADFERDADSLRRRFTANNGNTGNDAERKGERSSASVNEKKNPQFCKRSKVAPDGHSVATIAVFDVVKLTLLRGRKVRSLEMSRSGICTRNTNTGIATNTWQWAEGIYFFISLDSMTEFITIFNF